MLDVILPGTGGTMPLKSRWLATAYIRFQGSVLLIDCGEGTQIALRECGCSLKAIDAICLTHFHADHISGLPGLLLSMGGDGRTEPVTILGPPGAERVVSALRIIAQDLPFSLQINELSDRQMTWQLGTVKLQAFGLRHGVTCYGYVLDIPRAGRFDPDRARQQGVPLAAWSRLQKQPEVIIDGQCYTQEQVMGPPRRGLKLCYAVDTRPIAKIAEMADRADLFICEGTFGDPEKKDRARKTGHMLFSDAAGLAARAGVRELWLTHFSTSMPEPERFLHYASRVFPNTVCGHDGMRTALRFVE